MLGIDRQQPVADRPPVWESIAVRAQLPVEVHEYLGKDGAMPVHPDSRRGYHRIYMRLRAVLRYADEFYAAYVSDISRSGVGFFSPVQLLPVSPIELWLPDGRRLVLSTKVCVRVQQNCYRCGAVFTNHK